MKEIDLALCVGGITVQISSTFPHCNRATAVKTQNTDKGGIRTEGGYLRSNANSITTHKTLWSRGIHLNYDCWGITSVWLDTHTEQTWSNSLWLTNAEYFRTRSWDPPRPSLRASSRRPSAWAARPSWGTRAHPREPRPRLRARTSRRSSRRHQTRRQSGGRRPRCRGRSCSIRSRRLRTGSRCSKPTLNLRPCLCRALKSLRRLSTLTNNWDNSRKFMTGIKSFARSPWARKAMRSKTSFLRCRSARSSQADTKSLRNPSWCAREARRCCKSFMISIKN